MSKLERMTIVLSEPMAADIRAAVEGGEYATASEVVRDAMRLWSLRQELRQKQIEQIRQAWDEGIASGIAGPFDMDKILAEARARLGSAERKHG